jgi:CHAD domain-containing protein
MTVAQLPKSASKAISRTRLPKSRRPLPKLSAAMPCDTAFRILAGRYLKDLIANHEATCKGNAEALHQMRVSLTHLRAAIQFFSPMVDDPLKGEIRNDLKWLNGELGALRDLDVAIAGIEKANPTRPQAAPDLQMWRDKRAAAQRELSRSLKSARYRRVIKRTSGWIEGGRWATMRSRPAAKRRATPVGSYSADRLAKWEDELLRKSRKLRKMGVRKRHRLRLLNKKLNCSIASVAELFGDKRLSQQKMAMKHLRKAQKSLGQLNDDVRAQELALELRREGIKPAFHSFGIKRKKRLLRTTEAAYRKLAALERWK